jgi:hypothetical protein
MVKKLFIIIAYLVVFASSFIVFLPKENLYYFLEKKLLEQKIIIDNETLEDKGFYLNIENPTLYFDGILILKCMQVDIKPWIVYNNIEIKNIRLASNIATIIPPNLKPIIPRSIDSIRIYHLFYNPTKIYFKINSDFGDVKGFLNILDKTIIFKSTNKLGDLKAKIDLSKHRGVLNLKPSKIAKTKYKSILYRFKKLKDGGYKYEVRF